MSYAQKTVLTPPTAIARIADGTQLGDVAPCRSKSGQVISGYFISPSGKVYSNKQGGTLLPMAIRTDRYGYLYARLRIGGVNTEHAIHRLVARAFIPNPHNLTDVNHKDRNPENNTIENLEWISTNDNNRHAHLLSNDEVKERFIKLPAYGVFLEIDFTKKPKYSAYKQRKFYIKFLKPTSILHTDGYRTMCNIRKLLRTYANQNGL